MELITDSNMWFLPQLCHWWHGILTTMERFG